MPQRKDEICLNVMAAKAERNECIAHGSILNADNAKWTTSNQGPNRARLNGHPAREYGASASEMVRIPLG